MKPGEIFKNLFFSLFVVIVFFVSLELLQRIRYSYVYNNKTFLLYGITQDLKQQQQYQDKTRIRWIDTFAEIPFVHYDGYVKLKPGDYVREYKWKRFPVHVNKFGYRGTEIDDVKGPNVLRIVMTGASSTLAFESDDAHTYPAILETLINKDALFLKSIGREKAEVVNAGSGGQQTRQIIAFLQGELPNLKSDIVTFYEGFNEHHANGVFDTGSRFENCVFSKILGRTWVWFYRHSLLFCSAYEKFYLYPKKKISLENAEGVFKRFEQNILQMVKLTREHGAQLMLVKQVLYFEKLPYRLQDEEAVGRIEAKIRNNELISFDEAYYWAQSRELDILDKIAKEENLPIVNPINAFERENKAELFHDIVHPTEKGNAVLADEIFDGIKKYYSSRS